MTLSIVHVLPRFSEASSGPSLSVPSLCRALELFGNNVRLFALEPLPKRELAFGKTQVFKGCGLPVAKRYGVSKFLLSALVEAAHSSDIIHANNLWLMPSMYPTRAILGTLCKVVVSPRGALSPSALRYSSCRKKIAWVLAQRRCLETAHCIHVTSDEECRQVRDAGFKNPVAIIPNGVTVPENLQAKRHSVDNRRTLLYLARIHPIKGVDILLDAWRVLEVEYPSWDLRVVGPIDSVYARNMVKKAGLLKLQRVAFSGEVTGVAKARAFADSELYVLPSYSENFGISVAEALSWGVPAVVFRGAPWEGLHTHRAGWWIEPGIESLVETLRTAMASPPAELRELGQNGRAWVQRDFDWAGIARRMTEVYRWVSSGGSPPSDVEMS